MRDDLWDRISQLEDELFEEEEDFDDEYDEDEEDELGPGYNYAADFSRTMYADEDYPEEAPRRKPSVNRNIRGLKYLALLEIIGILLIIGWWLRWLI